MLSFIITIISLVANWVIYKKMGREGWEGIISFYSVYVLCEELYGNGWKCLLGLIPLGDATYRDGSMENTKDDFVAQVIDKTKLTCRIHIQKAGDTLFPLLFAFSYR